MGITGIICPCRQELEPFFKLVDNITEAELKMPKIFTGSIGLNNIVLCSSGIGKVNSAVAAQIMIDRFNVDEIIISGTAGGMDKRTRLFDTVICREAVYHDFAGGYLRTEFPHMQEAVFKADKKITEDLIEDEYIYGCIATGDKFTYYKNRAKIIEKFRPICVDMETAAVAHCCYINEIPFAAIRTITDTPECSGVDNCLKNLDKAAQISANTVMEILKNR